MPSIGPTALLKRPRHLQSHGYLRACAASTGRSEAQDRLSPSKGGRGEARLFHRKWPATSNPYDSNRFWLNAYGQLPPCRWKPALRARSSRTLGSGSVPTTRSPGTSTVGEVAASAGAAAAYDTGAGAAPTVEPKMVGGKAEHPQWAPAAIITAAAVAIVFNVMSHFTHLLRGVRSHSSYATPPKTRG